MDVAPQRRLYPWLFTLPWPCTSKCWDVHLAICCLDKSFTHGHIRSTTCGSPSDPVHSWQAIHVWDTKLDWVWGIWRKFLLGKLLNIWKRTGLLKLWKHTITRLLNGIYILGKWQTYMDNIQSWYNYIIMISHKNWGTFPMVITTCLSLESSRLENPP